MNGRCRVSGNPTRSIHTHWGRIGVKSVRPVIRPCTFPIGYFRSQISRPSAWRLTWRGFANCS